MTAAAPAGTAERILDVAERLVQTRGYNGFSYADVAAELGITKPSLHYHFASKAELGETLITRYHTRFAAALGSIDAAGGDAGTKLRRYAALYADVLDKQRMCLCGMLAADLETLPGGMRDAVVRFFDASETWLEGVLDEGKVSGTIRNDSPSHDQARMVISALEGAMLVSRSYHDPARFRAVARRLVAALSAEPRDG
jgi:TetR/AcrR family transcriptional repressor of nem operon